LPNEDIKFRTIGFPKELIDKGDAVARYQGMSFAAFIRYLLRKSIEENHPGERDEQEAEIKE
jgi:metal-responsive CopG/Arc/MetJ family transcriptional regulator